MDELLILKNKSKLVPLGLLAVLFLLLGVTMLNTPESYVGRLWNSLNLIRSLGGISLVFFWVTMFIGVRALTNQTPELTLDRHGFTSRKGLINKQSVSQGEKFLWKNIKNIRQNTVNKQQVIEIEFNDEDGFSGSSVQISSADLELDFDELLEQFKNYHQATRV